MKSLFIFLFIFSFGCSNKVQKDQAIISATSQTEDSLQQDIETMTFDDIYNDYSKNYYEINKLDTTILVNHEKYKIKFDYHCLFDSSLVVPYRFYEGDLNNDFVTHNFVINIEVASASQMIFKGELLKNAFEDCITEDLNKYGALLYPYFYNYDDKTQSFIFGFSISIPLTDIGRGVYFAIDLNGHTKCLSKI